MIRLYTTNCPKCKILEKKLDNLSLKYEKIDDIDKVVEIGTKHNILSAPILEIDDVMYDFSSANKQLNKL